jgi:hypothetical protein
VLLLASALAIKGAFLVRDGAAYVGGFVAGAAVCANLKPEGVTRVEFRDCMNARGYE